MKAARSVMAGISVCSLLTCLTSAAEAKKPDDELVAPEQRGIDGKGNRPLAEEEDPLPDGPAGEFGIANSWAFSSDAALLIQRATQSQVGGAVTTVTLSPATDIFLARNLSVGGFVSFTYTKAGANDSMRIAVGPRVGYNIPFSKRGSIWPKIGFSYARTSSTVMSGGESRRSMREVDQDAVALNFFVPVMFHPVTHFFLGFGPFLDTDMNGDNRATVWGGKLTLGGWL